VLARIQNEPAVVITIIEAGIALGLAFGLQLTGEQVAAIMAFVVALGGLFIRSQAYGPATGANLESEIARLEGEMLSP
jgi:hypothetical protein